MLDDPGGRPRRAPGSDRDEQAGLDEQARRDQVTVGPPVLCRTPGPGV